MKTKDPTTLHATAQVMFTTRPRVAVTCPLCWTEQRSRRNTCYHCEARFVYADEQAPAMPPPNNTPQKTG